jgi:hypothetical protein
MQSLTKMIAGRWATEISYGPGAATSPETVSHGEHFFAKTALRAYAETVANDQHPDHQLRVDRRSAGVAIERGKIGAQI